MGETYPNIAGRVVVWLSANIAILLSVALSNGLIAFFLGIVCSCLLSAWMMSAFLVRRGRQRRDTNQLVNTILSAVGILAPSALAYGHPIYIAILLAVVIHELRILSRYGYGKAGAFFIPLVSTLPLIPISHSSYAPLAVLGTIGPLIGYVVLVALLLVDLLLLMRDDQILLPLVGKTTDTDGFEKVGVPKWLGRSLASSQRGDSRTPSQDIGASWMLSAQHVTRVVASFARHGSKSPGACGEDAAAEVARSLRSGSTIDSLPDAMLASMPMEVRSAFDEQPNLWRMQRASIGGELLLYAFARLCLMAAGAFGRKQWHQFTEGVLKFAPSVFLADSLGELSTSAHITQYINDQDACFDRFRSSYPPECYSALEKSAREIERVVLDALQSALQH